MDNQNINFYKRTSIKWRAVILVTILMLFSIIGRVFGAVIFEDDFEGYDLGNLNGQGGWSGSTSYQVVETQAHSGTQSAFITDIDDSHHITKDGAELQTLGLQSIRFYFNGETAGTTRQTVWYLLNEDEGLISALFFRYDTGTSKWRFLYQQGVDPYGLVVLDDDVELDTWHAVQVEYDIANWRYKVKLNNGDWTDWLDFFDYLEGSTEGIKSIRILVNGMQLWFDTIAGEVEFEPYIEVTDPVTEDTITDLETSITIKYYYIDPEIYDGIIVYFQNEYGIASTPIYEEIAEASGTINTDFATFELDKNGKWYFRGMAYFQELDTYGDLYLTDRGYIQKYTGNLVSPAFWITLDIEGFEEIFYMSDFETWYGEEVEEFDAPTGTFLRFANFFTPIFDKVGGFADEMEEMFNGDIAYDKGYTLGLIIPLARNHFEIIRVFTGGFPVFEFLAIIIIIMFATILIKIITKFIPLFQ
jgi:hypothetical protein